MPPDLPRRRLLASLGAVALAGVGLARYPTDVALPSPPDPDLTQMVPIPVGINPGLAAVSPEQMIAALGDPGIPKPECGLPSPSLQRITIDSDVGPFRVTGLRPAVEALTRAFAAVAEVRPDLYSALGTAGMLCVRFVRGSTTSLSNHAWGSAVDITIAGILTPRGSYTVQQGLVDLAPFMAAERFFWGAGFTTTPDGMHFEASAELIADWKAQGAIP